MTRSRLSGPRFSGTEIIGVLLIVVGAFYLLRNAGVIDVDWSTLWPLLIVLVGVIDIFRVDYAIIESADNGAVLKIDSHGV